MADKKRFARLWVFLRPNRGRLLAVVAQTVVLSVLVMVPPLLIRGMIDNVIGDGRRELFALFALGLLLVPVIANVAAYIQTASLAYVGQRFIFDVRYRLYQHLLGLSVRFYSDHSTGMLVNRLMGDSSVVQQVVTAQTIGILSDLVCASFALAATLLISWRLALVMAVIIVVFVLNYRSNIKQIRDATRSYQGSVDRLSGGIQNRLITSVAVKTFGTENREHAQFRDTLTAGLSLVQEAMTANNRFNMNTSLINLGGRSILYFLGCALVLRGEITYGDVIAFTTYATQLLLPAVRFSMIAKQFQDVGIALDRLMELFDEQPEIIDTPEATRVRRLRGAVDFEHVEFAYVPGKPVIKDFDLHVEPGMTIALIGPTGCGKSTILSLVLRFFEVTGGRLLMDGRPIDSIRLQSLRRQFGIVLQEPMLFTVSIGENIAYGRPDATQQEIEDAARVAEIHDFIAHLPDGYATRIGAEGVDLSVGQRQRITIARAVLADPAILIMDEATSALDSDSERAIQRAMERVLTNRTCFVVAHRLSTIRNADQIVLLDDGYIVERGTHEELMALPDGRYHELYQKHMGQGVIDE